MAAPINTKWYQYIGDGKKIMVKAVMKGPKIGDLVDKKGNVIVKDYQVVSDEKAVVK